MLNMRNDKESQINFLGLIATNNSKIFKKIFNIYLIQSKFENIRLTQIENKVKSLKL
jgi:hypothetical protein